MEGQVGAVQEEKPNMDVYVNTWGQCQGKVFSILPRIKQLSVQSTSATFPLVISLVITSGSSASQSTVRTAIEAADTISLGTTHL